MIRFSEQCFKHDAACSLFADDKNRGGEKKRMKAKFVNGEGEGAHKDGYEKAAFGATDAGIPYNLTDLADIILKKDGELIIYPVINEYKFEFVSKYKLPFKRIVSIKPLGCNWNCGWCPIKFSVLKDATPIRMSINQIMDLLFNLGDNEETALQISGGEPLLQKEEVLKLIESLKTKTNYVVMLLTNGSLIDEEFIENANDLGLDGINISFRHLDDGWHKRYTGGHSIQGTIKALKLVTKNFKGLATVSLILFPQIDTATFENMCKFLHEINPDFVIKIFCPYHERKDCMKGSKRSKAEEIALHYFWHMDRTSDFSKQIKSTRYLIEEGERGHMDLVKSREWTSLKKGGES